MRVSYQDFEEQILAMDWRLRLPLVRKQAKRIIAIMPNEVNHWVSCKRLGYTVATSPSAVRAAYKFRYKAFPWIWLVGIIVDLVFKWWLNRNRCGVEPA